MVKNVISYYIFTCLVFSFSVQANQLYCKEALIDLSESEFYQVIDPINHNLMVIGNIVDRSLFLSIFTQGNNGERSPLLKGKEQFSKVLLHLSGQFDSITGQWKQMDDYEKSYNLDIFNSEIQKGASVEAAALSTWTGKQSIKHGFNKVELRHTKSNDGLYTYVEAVFSKSQDGL